MTTLIAQYNSEGCVGRCDAKCYMDNTAQLAEQWIEKYRESHPEVERYYVRKNGKLVRHEQMELFAEVTHVEKKSAGRAFKAGCAAPSGRKGSGTHPAALQPAGDLAQR